MSRKHINNKIVKCQQCGVEFIVKEYSNRKFCSEVCSRANWKNSRNNSILVSCVVCGKEYYAWPSRLKEEKDKCCSKECANILMKKTSFFSTNNPSKTDKRKLEISNQHRGSRCYWWMGGTSPLRTKIYRSDIFRNWRKEVFKRDNWTCQECGVIGGCLQAHHIKPFSDIVKENNIKTLEDALHCKELGNIDNGITLCKECHKLTDSYGWKNQFRK